METEKGHAIFIFLTRSDTLIKIMLFERLKISFAQLIFLFEQHN